MNTNMIINKLSTKRNGQFFNISYVSDLPMTAKAKREGIVALKITKATVRKGISYKNMKSVQERLGDRINEPLDLPWEVGFPNIGACSLNTKERLICVFIVPLTRINLFILSMEKKFLLMN